MSADGGAERSVGAGTGCVFTVLNTLDSWYAGNDLISSPVAVALVVSYLAAVMTWASRMAVHKARSRLRAHLRVPVRPCRRRWCYGACRHGGACECSTTYQLPRG